MDFILNIINSLHLIIKQLAIKKWLKSGLTCLSLFAITTLTLANALPEYNYKLIANTKNEDIANQQWLQLIANPSNNQEFYLASKKGQIYLIEEGEIINQALLDLSQLNKQSHQEVQLTAFALHPDFSFRDQPGFATFYTAHISPINAKSKTKRLQVKDKEIDYQFDSVITEWQFNQVNLSRIELSTQREILRVSLPSKALGINQLSFNPFKKSWNDDYGLLFFSLPAVPNLGHLPLYSGAILRINPQRFGRKNYTLPRDNPYLNNIDIANEIILLGAQDIKQFIWPKKNNVQLLVSHQYKTKHLLSFTEKVNDWRTEIPKTLVSHQLKTSLMMLYQGRSLSQLNKHLLYLDKTGENWQLNSLNINNKLEIEQNIEQQLPIKNWPLADEVKIFSDHSNEMLLLDQSKAAIYRISQNNTLAVDQPQISSKSAENISSLLWWILLLLGIVSVAYFYFQTSKNKRRVLSSLVKHNFAHLEVSQSKHQVGLYRRHQHTTDTILTVADITASEVSLNDTVISVINLSNEHGFSHALEADLRHYFSSEYQDKMVDSKVRKITLTLSDDNNSYPISLYARKGNQRLTKKSYKDVIDDLIDWCWLVSSTINVGHTEQKKVQRVVQDNSPKTSQSDTQKKHQFIEKKSNIISPESAQEPQAKAKKCPNVKSQTKAPTANHETVIDAELVNTLEKLVKLKQQGFLTDEEFSKAKEQLLAKLMQ